MDESLRPYPKRNWLVLALGRLGWIFAVFLTVGLGALVGAGFQIVEGRAFNARAVEVVGEVTYLAPGAIPCSKVNSGRCPETLVRFRFDTPNGPAMGEARLDRDYRPALRHGGPIALRFMPGDAARVEVEFGRTLRVGVFELVGSGVFLLIGSCFGSYVWWANHLTRMLRLGLPGTARVSDKGPERDPLLGTWSVRWTDDAGLAGKSQWYWRAASLPGAGAAITVFCDPEGKRPSVWEGDCGSRAT